MYDFLRTNRLFLGCTIVFLLVAGLLLTFIQTGDEIFYFSAHRSTLGDALFKYGTRLGEEYVYFLLIFACLFIRYRYALLLGLTGLSVMGLSYLLKAFFGHARPAAYFHQVNLFDQLQLVDGVVLHSGATSFPSGHTMSAFALYGLLAFIVPNKKGAAFGLFVLALLVGVSRIYLVQHFLQDVYVGAIIGLFLAGLAYWLQLQLSDDRDQWYNRRIGLFGG
ncbi:MAG: phosphatase PAP2 family protein [Saprospiraceae bacterium]|nr:phosphatase PAP2 family protein [Saprospiraceae bacterium]MCB0625293.1 phosphatase PAP2 family protein [Saprospiraceae bacterium]MCB0683963.1 phosphatase PAP2 family protein [Saprospiraceae bacterium]